MTALADALAEAAAKPQSSRRRMTLPLSVDAETRSVEIVASTGADVMRTGLLPDGTGYGVYIERLSIEGADLSRFRSGANVLVDHLARTDFVVGRIEDARVDAGRIIVTARFGESRRAAEVWRDVQSGILTSASIGYGVTSWRKAGNRDGVPIFEAARWTPVELSMVAVLADPGSRVRSLPDDGDMAMTLEAPAPEVPASNAPPAAPPLSDFERGIAAERERSNTLRHCGRQLRVAEPLVDDLIRTGVEVEAGRARLIDIAAQNPSTQPLRVHGGEDYTDPDHARRGMVAALAHRFSGGVSDLPEHAQRYRSATLVDLARQTLATTGERAWSLSGSAVVERAFTRSGLHSTGDFPLLLADASQKALLDTYQRLLPALTAVARRSLASDFKLLRRVRLGEAPPLVEVGEHGEIPFGTVGESGESFKVRSWARRFGLTRQAIVNDDLGAFVGFGNEMALSAATTLGDLLWTVLSSNAAMSDGVALFHANHGNLAGTGSAISIASLGAARLAMRTQKGQSGQVIQVAPAILVVGPATETAAEQVLATIAADAPANVNPFSGRLTLVVEPRITGNGWYVFAAPAQAPVLEYAELDGSRPMSGTGPRVETRAGWEVDGQEFKVVYDVGAGAVGYQGAYRNAGA